MARKLLCLGALITLASLAQVAPGNASMYAFPGLSEPLGTWTEMPAIDHDHTKFSVNLVYDTFNTVGNIRISLNFSSLPIVSSINLELITTADYNSEREGGRYRRNWGEILSGFDHNRDNTSFIFTATLTEVLGDGDHFGFITCFSFSMSQADPLATPVPLPGTLWLLGTGLLGLAGLRPHLRK